MGVVYRAYDEVLHRDVALKLLAQGNDFDQQSKEFLMHEARASSGLSHPNICTIYEIGDFDGEPFIVMEWIEGKPLSSMIVNDGLAVESVMCATAFRLPVRWLIRITGQSFTGI